jgi:hypothetical protein
MNYTTVKQIKSFCDDLMSSPYWREVTLEINNDNPDFEVDGVRFIHTDSIDEIVVDELSGDKYILGCFNSWCIAEATGWPEFLIELAQQSDKCEELGEKMTSDHIKELAEQLVSHDGYGHHFNRYDGGEEELTVNGQLYHVFDNQ